MEVTILRKNSKGVAVGAKQFRRASSTVDIFDFNAFANVSSDSEDDDSRVDNNNNTDSDDEGAGGGGKGRRGGAYSYDNPVRVSFAEEGGSDGGSDVAQRTLGTASTGSDRQHPASPASSQAKGSSAGEGDWKLPKKSDLSGRKAPVGSIPNTLPHDKHHMDMYRQLDNVSEDDDDDDDDEEEETSDEKKPKSSADPKRRSRYHHVPVKSTLSQPSNNPRSKPPLLKRLSMPLVKTSSSRRHTLSDVAEARKQAVEWLSDDSVLSSDLTTPSAAGAVTPASNNGQDTTPSVRRHGPPHPQTVNFHYGPAQCQTHHRQEADDDDNNPDTNAKHAQNSVRKHSLKPKLKSHLTQSKSVDIPSATAPRVNTHRKHKKRAQSLHDLTTKSPRDGNHRLQMQPLTKSLQELSQKATSPEEAVTTQHNLLGSGSENPVEEGNRKVKPGVSKGSWLWSLVRRSAASAKPQKTRGIADDQTRGELSTVFEDDSATTGRQKTFTSRVPESDSKAAQVFTLTGDNLFCTDNLGVSPGTSPSGGWLPAGQHSPVLWRHITLQRPPSPHAPGSADVMPFWHPQHEHHADADPPSRLKPPPPSPRSRAPSPLFRLSGEGARKKGERRGGGDYTALDEDAVSLTSLSVTSLTDESSICSEEDGDLRGEKPTGSGGGGRRRGRGKGVRFDSHSRESSTERILRDDDEDEDHEEGEGADVRGHRKLTRARAYRNGNEPYRPGRATDGPRGKMFTAKLVRRLGGSGGCFTLSNATHVSHVYKGTVLVTDMLEGKIVFAAGSGGRSSRVFAAEKGAEPWCACMTSGGHVAVTLRRPSASVTVWSGGRGLLIREFGQGVLEGPTGLAIDRQGRFIVADERTNRVAFFSAGGEFLRYLSYPPDCDPPHPRHQQKHRDSGGRQQRRATTATTANHSDGSTGRVDDDDDADDKEALDNRLSRSDNASSAGRNESPAVRRKANSKGNSVKWNLTDPHPRYQNYRNKHPQYGGIDDDGDDVESCPGNADDYKPSPPRTTASRHGDQVRHHHHHNHQRRAAAGSSDDVDCAPYIFNNPRYLCTSPVSGKILVSDSGSHCVRVFTPEGVYLRSIGSPGTSDGQLKVPYGVCCDLEENVYIADHYNDRVSVFSIDGVFLQQALTSVCGLSRPKSVAIRPSQVRKLYVTHGGLRATEVVVYRLDDCPRTITFQCDV